MSSNKYVKFYGIYEDGSGVYGRSLIDGLAIATRPSLHNHYIDDRNITILEVSSSAIENRKEYAVVVAYDSGNKDCILSRADFDKAVSETYFYSHICKVMFKAETYKVVSLDYIYKNTYNSKTSVEILIKNILSQYTEEE